MQKRQKRAIAASAFIVSAALMTVEGLLLHNLDVQRHDSMYIALLPCMFALFQLVLSLELTPSKMLRTVSTWIYILHPLCIVLVRGVAKIAGLENVLVGNSFVHFVAVCLLSAALAMVVGKITALAGERAKTEKFLASERGEMRKQESENDTSAHAEGRAWIEVDRESLRKNVAALRSLLPDGCELMPAVKANAYGHGGVLVAKELAQLGIASFCVATASEAVELRENGIDGDILILGYTHPEQFPLLRKYNLTQTVVDCNYARELDACGETLKVHIKIDTGMHRLGERAERIDEICSIFSCENLLVTGTFTHLCSADTTAAGDKEFTMKQGEGFLRAVSELKRRGYDCGKVHLLASYGLLNYPELGGDYARIGIALYGVLSSRDDLKTCPIELSPVMAVKARIATTKELRAGESAGYGLQYTAESDRRIAVLTIGYADGLPRALSCGRGKILINGHEAPIIGRICMDQTLVDISDIPDVNSGDVAVIIGKSGTREISVYDIAEECGTITNEVLSRLGSRLNRTVV